MLQYLLSGIATYCEYIFFFFIFSFILSYTGRIVLLICTNTKHEYLDISTIICGFSVYLLVAYYWVTFLQYDLMKLQYVYLITSIGILFVNLIYFLYKHGVGQILKTLKATDSSVALCVFFGAALSLFFLVNGKAGFPPLYILNNDIFFWSIFSDFYRGVFNPIHMVTAPSDYIEYLKSDAVGSYLSLGLYATLMNGLSIYIIPKFVFCLFIWTGLGITKCIILVFRIHLYSAATIALMVVTSTAYMYMSFRYFLGQQLIMTAIYPFILALLGQYRNVFFKCAALFFPTLFMFLVYQSGFLVFLIVGLSYAITAVFFKKIIAQKFWTVLSEIVKQYLVPVCIVLCVCFALLPNVLIHWYHRTVTVVGIVAGWTLPLVNPLHVFSLPNFICFDAGSTLNTYICFLLVLFIFWGYSLYNFKKSYVYRVELGLTLLLALYVSVYLLDYYVNGSRYQTWKFLLFTTLPLSFIPLSIIFKQIESLMGAKQKYLYCTLVVVCCLTVSISAYSFRNLTAVNYYPVLNHLKLLQSEFRGKSVVLNLSFTDTLAAASVILDKNFIYPRNLSYIPPASKELIDSLPKDADIIANSSEHVFKAHENDKQIILDVSGKIPVVNGMYSKEAWGRWANGPQSQIILQVPDDLAGKQFYLSLEVTPFIGGKNTFQPLEIFLNNKNIESTEITKQTKIVLLIPSNAGEQLILDFKHPMGISPASLGLSQDVRELSIGFTDLNFATTPEVTISGLSVMEDWGQWSDGNVIDLTVQPALPNKFLLELEVAHVFADNDKFPVYLKAGLQEKSLMIEKPGKYSVLFENINGIRNIQIIIPKPTSPKELGVSNDTRRLGFGFVPNGIKILD